MGELKGFKKCDLGHFYKENLDNCPYCPVRQSIHHFQQDGLILNEKLDLLSKSKCIILIGKAPDNLPLYLEINHLDHFINDKEIGSFFKIVENFSENSNLQIPEIIENIQNGVQNISSIFNNSHFSKNEIFAEIWLKLIGDICKIFPYKNIVAANGIGTCYISENNLLTIIGDTILERILTTRPQDYLHSNFNKLPIVKNDKSVLAKNRKLAIPIFNNQIFSLVEHENNEIDNKSIQEFQFETFDQLKPKYFKYDTIANERIEVKNSENFFTENFSNAERYYDNRTIGLKISIDKEKILFCFHSLLDEIEKTHELGFVHGDLKPQNIILSEIGFIPIDSLNIKQNTISESFTVDFCSPEQILYKPVNQTSDIYSLGLLILSLFKGYIFGETKNFLIPINSHLLNLPKTITPIPIADTQIVERKIIVSPQIILTDPYFNKTDSKDAWTKFLSNCLAFDANDRFQTISDFRKEFDNLLNLYPINGQIEIEPEFGKLCTINDNYGWLISDITKAENLKNIDYTGKECPKCKTFLPLNAPRCNICGYGFTVL